MDSTPIIVATLSLLGTSIGALVMWLLGRKKPAIEESTATTANAAALSKASLELVAVFRQDVDDLRTEARKQAERLERQAERLERQNARIDMLEVRDRMWSRFYADLHERWPYHRQQDSAPTIDP